MAWVSSAVTSSSAPPKLSHRKRDVLPSSLPPRGLSRGEAAAYIGLSPSKFDELVNDGRMPRPKRIVGRVIWCRRRLDEAFDALPDDGDRTDDVWGQMAL